MASYSISTYALWNEAMIPKLCSGILNKEGEVNWFWEPYWSDARQRNVWSVFHEITMKITNEFACASRKTIKACRKHRQTFLVSGTEENQEKYCNSL
jgi:hypothetical protein